MCIALFYNALFLGSDVINLEVNLIFLIKLFSYLTKNQYKYLSILRTKRAFNVFKKAFSAIWLLDWLFFGQLIDWFSDWLFTWLAFLFFFFAWSLRNMICLFSRNWSKYWLTILLTDSLVSLFVAWSLRKEYDIFIEFGIDWSTTDSLAIYKYYWYLLITHQKNWWNLQYSYCVILL